MRIALHVNADAMTRLMDEKAWVKLTPDSQAAWRRALEPHVGSMHPFAWVESSVDETARNDAAVGKVAKAFIKAMVKPLASTGFCLTFPMRGSIKPS